MIVCMKTGTVLSLLFAINISMPNTAQIRPIRLITA